MHMYMDRISTCVLCIVHDIPLCCTVVMIILIFIEDINLAIIINNSIFACIGSYQKGT